MKRIRIQCYDLSCLLDPDTNESIYPEDLDISCSLRKALSNFHMNGENNVPLSFIGKVIYETEGLNLALDVHHELKDDYEIEFFSYLHDKLLILPRVL